MILAFQYQTLWSHFWIIVHFQSGFRAMPGLQMAKGHSTICKPGILVQFSDHGSKTGPFDDPTLFLTIWKQELSENRTYSPFYICIVYPSMVPFLLRIESTSSLVRQVNQGSSVKWPWYMKKIYFYFNLSYSPEYYSFLYPLKLSHLKREAVPHTRKLSRAQGGV